MKEIKISVFEQVAGNAAVSSEDGDLLFKRLLEALKNDMRVALDFNNIELITSSFLNAAIGQLYSQYDSPFLNKHIKLENITREDIDLIGKVVERAKEYFKNKEKVEKGIKEVLG
jgi:hypothetical protein